MVLRWFGARIGRGVRIDPSVHVEVPWHLALADGVCVGPGAILYCLGEVEIGEGTLVGPLVHVCAGTHDYTDPRFTLLRSPIRIGARCLLQTASFVAPGITLADGVILAERAGIYRSVTEPGMYIGNPAKRVAEHASVVSGERHE